MRRFLQNAVSILNGDEEFLKEHLAVPASGIGIYRDSIRKRGETVVTMARSDEGRSLLLLAPSRTELFDAFEGEIVCDDVGIAAKQCPLSAGNAAALREVFPWTAPVPVLRKKCSIGCGDRLGLATAAHAKVFKRFEAYPVFAQQSVRELTLTDRSFRSVIDDASFLVYQAGFEYGFAADGDHLKTLEQIRTALETGVTMLTLDLSEKLHPEFSEKNGAELLQTFQSLPDSLRRRLKETYENRTFHFGDLAIVFSSEELMRCAVIYSAALDFAAEAGQMLKTFGDGSTDLEISIDETTAPTLPEHHFFVANELQVRGVDFVSLAPRFIGEFQKGIDYIGDLEEFQKQLRGHAAIAEQFGFYKLSIHSGSDKFKTFPFIGDFTKGRFHLKTAGTSYLEAVRTIANADPALFREMWRTALNSLDAALKLYHITADFSKLPDLGQISNYELPSLLKDDTARQLLHITYGAMLGSKSPLRLRIRGTLHRYENIYEELLMKHFEKHLTLLHVPHRNKGKR